jgi:hypothetical protein
MSEKNLILEKLNSRAAKRGFFVPPEEIVFTIQDKPIGALGNFVCFQGLPKQGKSLYITSAIASAFTPFGLFDMRLKLPEDRSRICYIDTESSEYDFYRVMDRISHQASVKGWPDRLDAFLMREDSPSDIINMITAYLEQTPSCSCLVIDGVLDLLVDFNSIEQSFYVVQFLKQITARHKILVMLVLHLSKKEGNSLGHLGSFIDRKAQSVLKVQKNKNAGTIDLEATFLRSTGDIKPISVFWAGSFWMQANTGAALEPELPNATREKNFIETSFAEPRTYKETINLIIFFTERSDTTAKKILKKWIDAGRLVKDDNGLYSAK